MDVDKLIAELNAKIEKIKGTIACLEQLRGSSSAASDKSRPAPDISRRPLLPGGLFFSQNAFNCGSGPDGPSATLRGQDLESLA